MHNSNNKEKDCPYLFWDAIASAFSIYVVAILVAIIIECSETIENNPIIASVVTLVAVSLFGLMWFLRKISKS